MRCTTGFKKQRTEASHCISETVKISVSEISAFVGGRLKYFSSKWKELTQDSKIIDIVEHCHFEFCDTPQFTRVFLSRSLIK